MSTTKKKTASSKPPAAAPEVTKPIETIAAELVHQALRYEPENGFFYSRRTGQRLIARHGAGYISIRLAGRSWLGHRLAWIYVHGRWPINQLDHINGNRADNRIENLRECTNAQNCQNVRAHKDGVGLVGITFEKRRSRWTAGIGVNGKRIWLGYFGTADEAHNAYLAAKRKYHQFNAGAPSASQEARS